MKVDFPKQSSGNPREKFSLVLVLTHHPTPPASPFRRETGLLVAVPMATGRGWSLVTIVTVQPTSA